MHQGCNNLYEFMFSYQKSRVVGPDVFSGCFGRRFPILANSICQSPCKFCERREGKYLTEFDDD